MLRDFLQLDKSEWVAENDLAFAIRDAYPVSPGHTLVIPKRVISSWFETTIEEKIAIFSLVEETKLELEQIYKPDGYNVGINIGMEAGQTVMHLHVHLIPRMAQDVDNPEGGVRFVIPSKGNYRKPGFIPSTLKGADK